MSSSAPTSQKSLSSTGLGYSGSLNYQKFDHYNILMPEFSELDEAQLLSVSWNQDCSCFAAGTTRGFRIYNSSPFKETFRRDMMSGGFKIVEMLFQCNILALVGSDFNSLYPPNKVMVWDDRQRRCIGEFSFRSNVRAVKLRQDHIIVVLQHRVYVYNFIIPKLLHQIETSANSSGLCCLSQHSSTFMLACPGIRCGQIRVEHFGLNVTKLINAHNSQVACLSLTLDGLILATASTRGTLIRIFNTMDGSCLQEVRRGLNIATIYSIALSPCVQWLAVSSDKHTIHVFNLRVRVIAADSLRPDSNNDGAFDQNYCLLNFPIYQRDIPGFCYSISFIKGILPNYFNSERSFGKLHLKEGGRCIVAFGSENTLIIVGMDGCFRRCSFSYVEKGEGEIVEEENAEFLKTSTRYQA